MSFRRGATLSTAVTLGHADTSDLGPSAGNGFYKRWPDDLALLHELGLTEIRITLDWPRLQPKPGTLDADWAERFDAMLAAADAIDLRVWATLHDGGIPRWLDNEGGLADPEAFTRWWPRWVERAADRFGDQVHAWIPFVSIPDGAPEQPWRDTWDILGGTSAPVVASLRERDAAGAAAALAGRMDRLGVAFELPDQRADGATDAGGEGRRPGDGTASSHRSEADGEAERADDGVPVDATRSIEQWAELLHTAGDAADVPLVVTEFNCDHVDPATGGRIVARVVGAIDEAIADGVRVEAAFADPAIAGPDSPIGLLDKDRAAQPAALAFAADG